MKSLVLPAALVAVMSIAGCLGPSFRTVVSPSATAVLPRVPTSRIAAANDTTAVMLMADDPAAADAAIEMAHAQKIRDMQVPGMALVAVLTREKESALDLLRSAPGIAFAEEDDDVETAAAPSPMSPDTVDAATDAALAHLHAPEAWSYASAAGVRVAVLDSGLDPDETDLADRVVASANFTLGSFSMDDTIGHGTLVAGVVETAANGGADLMIGKVIEDSGRGSTSALTDAIIWAANQGARVICLSVTMKKPSLSIEKAIDFAWNRKNAIVVAAAGNKGGNGKVYPAACANAIAVGATKGLGDKAGYSNFGDWVDVAAPGIAMYHRRHLPKQPNKKDYPLTEGTSFAASVVAGEAALVWGELGCDAPNAGVRQRIEASCARAGNAPAHRTRCGVVDFLKAVQP